MTRTTATPPPRPPPPPAAQGIIDQQRKQIERLTEQLQALAATGVPEEVQHRDARIAELEEQLEQLQAQGSKGTMGKMVGGLVGAMNKGSKRSSQDLVAMQRIEALTAECDRYREEAEALRAQLEAGGAVPSGGGEETAALKTRIEVLEGELREAQNALKAQKAGLHIRQAEELAGQREQLAEAQQQLAVAEERMVRKWARPKAVVLLGWIILMAAVGAVASWYAAEVIVPPKRAAVVELEAEPPFGKTLTEQQARAWREWHIETLASEGFLRTVAQRLGDKRLEAYRSPTALAKRLNEDLTVDVTVDGRIVLMLAGADIPVIKALLDVIATSLAYESQQNVTRRVDNAPAVIRGEYDEAGLTRYARLVETPPEEDRRMLFALIFFTTGFIIAMLVMGRIYRWLLKAKHTIQEHQHFLETDGYDLDDVFG